MFAGCWQGVSAREVRNVGGRTVLAKRDGIGRYRIGHRHRFDIDRFVTTVYVDNNCTRRIAGEDFCLVVRIGNSLGGTESTTANGYRERIGAPIR